jgi:hypothetical protein
VAESSTEEYGSKRTVLLLLLAAAADDDDDDDDNDVHKSFHQLSHPYLLTSRANPSLEGNSR